MEQNDISNWSFNVLAIKRKQNLCKLSKNGHNWYSNHVCPVLVAYSLEDPLQHSSTVTNFDHTFLAHFATFLFLPLCHLKTEIGNSKFQPLPTSPNQHLLMDCHKISYTWIKLISSNSIQLRFQLVSTSCITSKTQKKMNTFNIFKEDKYIT